MMVFVARATDHYPFSAFLRKTMGRLKNIDVRSLAKKVKAFRIPSIATQRKVLICENMHNVIHGESL